MRFTIFAALTALLQLTFVPCADAAVCARGVRGAACVGPHGAVAVRRPVAVCHMVAGRRVCR
jgi:hypothetical protein